MSERILMKAGIQSADDPLEFVMSSEKVDRDGDVIRQDGWDLRDFKRNPIALYQHNSNFPIGKWSDVRIEGKKLVGRLKFAEAGTSRIVDEVRSLVEQGILKTVSVGFAATDIEPRRSKAGGFEGLEIRAAQLRECSLVSIPSNSDAMARVKSLNLSPETMEFLNGSPAGGPSEKEIRLPAAPRPNLSRKSRCTGIPMPKRINEQIKELETKLSDIKDTVSEFVKAADDDGRDLNDEEIEQISTLKGEKAAIEKQLEAKRDIEEMMAKRVQDRADTKAAITLPARAAEKEEPGALLFKMAHVCLRADKEGRSIADVVKERYDHDDRVKAVASAFLTEKAAVVPADTTTAGNAQELVETNVAGFIDVLTGVSVYGRLAAAGVGIPFGGKNSVTVPGRDPSVSIPGSFVAEGASIPVKVGGFNSVTFNRFELDVITTFTRKLANVSNPQIEGLLRKGIIDDTVQTIDEGYLLDVTNAGVANLQPASPWNGASTQASAGDTLANIITDLKYLRSILTSSKAGFTPRIILHPDRADALRFITNGGDHFIFEEQMAAGNIKGTPYIESVYCPANTVFIVDADSFGTAFGTPQFEVSDTATVVMASDDGVAPSMEHSGGSNPGVDAAGSLHVSDAAGTTPPTVVRSMYQTNSRALKMTMPISWGMRRSGVAGYLTSVTW